MSEAVVRRSGCLGDAVGGRKQGTGVLVVGGGVSGCACAASLAAKGHGVTVISSALDSVGLPAYGPFLEASLEQGGLLADVLEGLEPVLRAAWQGAARFAASGEGAGYVDRRMLSVETKRALETMPGLCFRQGLVTGVRVETKGTGGRIRCVVETAFGEEIDGLAMVLAMGLSVGGRVGVGEQVALGGRYGETPAEGMRMAVEEIGAVLSETELRVGPRVSGQGEDGLQVGSFDCGKAVQGKVGEHRGWWRRGSVSAVGWAEGGERRPTGRGEGGSRAAMDEDGEQGIAGRWPEGYPPSPYEEGRLKARWMILWNDGAGCWTPLASPDGVATGEVYVAPEADGMELGTPRGRSDEGRGELENAGDGGVDGPGGAQGDRPERMCSRMEQMVSGLTVTNTTIRGRLAREGGEVPGVWVTGRLRGAASYGESLASGVAVAEDVAAWLSEMGTDE